MGVRTGFENNQSRETPENQELNNLRNATASATNAFESS